MLLFRNTSCFQKVSERYIDVVNTAVVKRFHNSHWHHDNVIIMLNYLHCTRYIPFFIFFNAHICHSNIAMKLVDWIFIMHLQFVIFKLGKTKLCNNFYIWKGRVRTRSNHYNAKILLTYENLMIFWRVYVRHFECGLGILIKQKFHCLFFCWSYISKNFCISYQNNSIFNGVHTFANFVKFNNWICSNSREKCYLFCQICALF